MKNNRKSKDPDWVVVGGRPGEIAHCKRCGDGLSVELPQRAEVVTAAMEAFAKAHSMCKPGNEPKERPMRPIEWMAGRDTGTSSLTICSIITGIPSYHARFDIPYDPDDFGRCYRLLATFPYMKDELWKVAKALPYWKPYIDNWAELTALYEEESPSKRCPKLYARMQVIRVESDKVLTPVFLPGAPYGETE